MTVEDAGIKLKSTVYKASALLAALSLLWNLENKSVGSWGSDFGLQFRYLKELPQILKISE